VLARTLLKGYTPVEGWPTEHLPSRRPAAEAKWAELRERAGLTTASDDRPVPSQGLVPGATH
jgi:hypothetical protein